MLEAASLSPFELGEFLRKNGLRDGDLERWKADATSGLRGGREYRGQSRRVRDLERQNRRYGKRLREAEALLELQKKVQALWEAGDDDMTQS